MITYKKECLQSKSHLRAAQKKKVQKVPISQYLSRTWGIWKIGWKGAAVSNGQATADDWEIM